MSEMSIETEEKVVTCRYTYLVVGGERYDLQMVINTLEELEDCDGINYVLHIDDLGLAKMLEMQSAAVRTTRGPHRAGDNRAAMLEQIEALKRAGT